MTAKCDMVEGMDNVPVPVSAHYIFKVFSFSKHSGNNGTEPRAFADVVIRVGDDGQRKRKGFEVVNRFSDDICVLEICDNESTIYPLAAETKGLYARRVGRQFVCKASCAGLFQRGKRSCHKGRLF